MTEWFQLGKFLGVLFLFAGFLVSIEVFREIRIPFTSIRLGRTRHEPAGAEELADAADSPDAADGHHGVRGTARSRSTRPDAVPGRDQHLAAEVTHPATPDQGAGIRPVHHGADACPDRAPDASAIDRPPVAGFVIVIVAASLFGTLGPLSRFAYDAGMEPLPFVVWRGPDRPGRDGRVRRVADPAREHAPDAAGRPRPERAPVSLAVAALMGFTLNLAMFISFDLVTVALALLGFYTYPVIVAVVNVALGRETLDRPRIVALALAIAGMVAVVASQLDPSAGIRFDAIGFGLALAAALSQAVFVVISKTGYQKVPAAQAMGVDPGDDGRVRVRPGLPDRRRRGARLPVAGPVGPAAARVHRAVRRGHPVDPVPDAGSGSSAARGPGS